MYVSSSKSGRFTDIFIKLVYLSPVTSHTLLLQILNMVKQ